MRLHPWEYLLWTIKQTQRFLHHKLDLLHVLPAKAGEMSRQPLDLIVVV